MSTSKISNAADFISNNKDHLICMWEERARWEILSVEDESEVLLKNHLVELLDDLVKSLRHVSISRQPRKASEEFFIKSRSEQHVAARYQSNDKYDVGEVMAEYIILRQVITDELSRAELCELEGVEAINRMFELASLEAVKSLMMTIHKCKQKIISTLVHDIRSPLSVAVSAHEVLYEFLSPGDLGKQMYSMVERSLDRALEMITSSLNQFSTNSRSRLVLDFKRINLSEVFRDTLKDLDQVYGSRLQIKRVDSNIYGVFADKILVRILENLISNAFKFGDSENPVSVSLLDCESEVSLRVHNLGRTIPKENQDKIFEMFQSNLGGIKKNIQGWGLGLSHVQIAAKAHGGRVKLVSNEELGTEFEIILNKDFQSEGEKEFSL